MGAIVDLARGNRRPRQALRKAPYNDVDNEACETWPQYASVLSTSHILQRDYKKAAGWARVAMRQPSSHFIAPMHLVAALGLLGDGKGAQKARAKLLLLKPDFSLDYVLRSWPFKHASDTARFLRGAGISN